MRSLPKVMLTLNLYRPDWRPIYGNDDLCINFDEAKADFQVECEVLSLNLNAGSMRVRYRWPKPFDGAKPQIQTDDVPITQFFNQYQITRV